jgi:hypothetical protein
MYRCLQVGMVIAINIFVSGATLPHSVAFGCSSSALLVMASSDIVVELCRLWCASCVVLYTAQVRLSECLVAVDCT